MDDEKMETAENESSEAVTEEHLNDIDDGDLGSSSSDDDDDESERQSRISGYVKALEETPYNYSLHEEYIKFLENGDDLIRLREAREHMARLFPLTPELWLRWIRQEVDLCLDEEEKLKVLELFQRAVKDYTSVDLWLEYCKFVTDLADATDEGLQRTRAVFEEACNKVGLHVHRGDSIFETYRDFERRLFDTIPNGPDRDKQRDRIVSLFKRQLSLPLLNLQKTLELLRAFDEDAVDSNLDLMVQKAHKKLKAVLPFERKLDELSTRTLFDYEPYLDFEIREGDPARIQMLFERAITDDCLRLALWEKYLKYMDLTLKIDSLALPIHERSIRNLPWCSSLWVSYLTCLERMSAPVEKVESTIREAQKVCLSSGTDALNLWIFHLSYIRRSIDFKEPRPETVEKLRTHFELAALDFQYSDLSFDESVAPILHYWATVEANLGNIQRARELWQRIMNHQFGSAKIWLNYANFERTYGDFKHYRKVLRRGLLAAVDNPEQIAEQWLQAELQEGTLEGLQEAEAKFEARMVAIKEIRQNAATAGTQGAASTTADVGKNKHVPKKRKATKSPEKDDPADRKGKFSKVDKDGFKVPFPVASKPTEASRKPEPPDDDPLREAQTVFLSNLAYEVEEEKIVEVFTDAGHIEDLRLVRDYKGRCKGYGYLMFSKLESVELALKKDRAPVDGRPLYVSRCNQRKQFEYRAGLEKNKIFVKNIPFDATKEELETLFGQCGALSDVRLCVLRNGKFKGMAYVDFVNEVSASNAIVKFDGFDLRDKSLSVALSNPPARKQKDHGQASQQKSKESSMKTRLFVPRSVQSKTASSSTQPDGSTSETVGPARSNDYFRDLFLKK